MDTLKRLLKPRALRRLLEKALPLAAQGTTLAVACGSEVVAWAGADESHALSPPPHAFRVPLSHQGIPVGELIICPPREHAPPGTISALGDFLRHTLQELLEKESARRSLGAETLDKYREIELLHSATLCLNKSRRIKDVCRALLEDCAKAVIPAEMGIIFIRDSEPDGTETRYAFGPALDCKLQAFPETRLYKDIWQNGRGEIINDLASDPRWNGEIEALRSLLVVPLQAPNLRMGSLVLASTEEAPFKAVHLKTISTIATVAAIAMGNAHHFENMQRLMDALLQALAAAIDARDPLTSGHSQRVAALSVALARVVSEDNRHFSGTAFNARELHEIFYAGLLHDVGKIGIREKVLTKTTRLSHARLEVIAMRMALHALQAPGDWRENFERLKSINRSSRLSPSDISFLEQMQNTEFSAAGLSSPLIQREEMDCLIVPEGNLTPEERREIERHPLESYRILQHIPFTADYSQLLTIIQQHHERLDGSGYPDSLSGPQILLQSRILSITDIYDAITQERHYKPAMTQAEALRILKSEAAKGKIDGNLVELFCTNIDCIEQAAARTERKSGNGQAASLSGPAPKQEKPLPTNGKAALHAFSANESSAS